MQILSGVEVGKRAFGNGLHYMVHHVSLVYSNTCKNEQYLLNIDTTRKLSPMNN